MEHFTPNFNSKKTFPFKKLASTGLTSQINCKTLNLKTKLVCNKYAILSNE